MNVFEWAVSSVLGSPNAQAGAIDVIAIRKADGGLSCSPFHVKLGKSSKKGEKGIVKVTVNGKDVELSMKLGPAGEAFFVERSRDFRRNPSASFPTSPRDPQHGEILLSPGISSPLDLFAVVGALEVGDDNPENDHTAIKMTAEADKPTDQEAGEPVVTSTARTSSPTQSMKFIRHRSFSEGALSLFQIQATSTVMESVSDQAHLPVQVVEQVQDSPEDGGGHYYHHHGISMDHNREQMATSADEHPVAGKPTAGTPSSTPLVPTLNLPSSTEASTASEGLGGENMQTLTLVTAVEPATVAVVVEEESAVSWIWRWGTLPKKTKPKSTTDLENLHTVAAMDPSNSKGTGQAAVVESSNIAPDARDSVLPQDSSADKKFSTSKAAAGKGRGRAVNVRHRAVSLPVLRQYEFMTEPTSTAGARQVEGYRALIPPELQDTADADSDDSNKDGRSNTVFTQLVTAIESDIAPGSPYKDKSIPDLGANAGAFSSMLAAARVDNSRFHALSLCGQLLTSPSDPLSDPSIDAAVPSNAAELRQLLEAHLISPHDIVQSESPILSGECKDTDTLQEVEERGSVCPSILSSPHLVVILDDFLLPLRAAEKLLQKICAMDRNMSGDGSESHTQTQGIVDPPSYTISEQEVRDVLRELESDLHREHAGQVVLPQWAGKRISLWGRGFESLEGAQIIFTDPPHGTPTMLDPAALVSADEIHSTAEEEEVVERDTGNTPLGHLSWQQSFSDLVQAYRVHNIHTIHSYLDLSARAHRFGDTYNEISDDGSGGGGVSSYTERWNRLQSSPGTSGSFTALLALDTRTIHRLYTSEQDLDKWAVGVGLCRTRTHSECNSRAVSHDAYDQDHPSASRGLSLSRDDGNDHVQVNKITTTSHHHHTVHSTLHIHHHHHQQQQQQQDESADHDYGVGEGYSFMSHSDNDNDGALRSAAGSHNSLPTLEEIVVDIDLEIDVDADVDAELIDGGVGASVEVKGEVTAFLAEGDEPIGVAVADVFVEDTVTAESATAAATEGDKDEPLRRPAPSTQQQQHYQQQNNYLHPLEDTNSTTDGAETDNDCLSLQDIDFEDISPEPATGDFYESDTDSYLSLSLEEGESGRYTNNNNNNSSRRNSMRNNTFSLGDTDQTAATAANNNDNTSAHEIQVGRRRIKRYLYRKVLVPSAEQLTALPLQDGVNEVGFELPGCNPLRSCLYLWPSDCRIVVTDIEGVFTHASAHHNPMNSTATVWMQFLGGGGTLNSRSVANKKAYFDEAIRLFRALHQQGYRILYIAQTSTNTTTSNSNSNTLLSSQEYLQRIKTSTGECLPPGPIFKSPDSLIRAFGASRTDVFKAGALKGVKSLFPSSHNPYHACFCIRESDSIPFARFGFPEGRIFLVSEKGDVKSANRTCNFTFPRLSELLHQIFPHVVDSQSSGASSSSSMKGGSAKLSEAEAQTSSSGASNIKIPSNNNNTTSRGPALEVDTSIPIATPTTTPPLTHATDSANHVNMNTAGVGAGATASSTTEVLSPQQQQQQQHTVVTPFSPTAAAAGAALQSPPQYHLSGNFPAISPVNNSLKSPKSIPFSSLPRGTEDTYNDYNFWKIPPQVIEDEFY